MAQPISCPICLETINEAMMTSCGHSFCKSCITAWLEKSKICPTCNTSTQTITPNYALRQAVEDAAQHIQTASQQILTIKADTHSTVTAAAVALVPSTIVPRTSTTAQASSSFLPSVENRTVQVFVRLILPTPTKNGEWSKSWPLKSSDGKLIGRTYVLDADLNKPSGEFARAVAAKTDFLDGTFELVFYDKVIGYLSEEPLRTLGVEKECTLTLRPNSNFLEPYARQHCPEFREFRSFLKHWA